MGSGAVFRPWGNAGTGTLDMAAGKQSALDGRELTALVAEATEDAEATVEKARTALRARLGDTGRIDRARLARAQSAAHGLAWFATYAVALRQLVLWAERLEAAGRFGETEALILRLGAGEYLAQVGSGIPMSQSEIARPADLGLKHGPGGGAARRLVTTGNTEDARRALVELMRAGAGGATVGDPGLDDEFRMMRDQFRRFAQKRIAPHAQDWHLRDALIPMDLVDEMAALGIFGLTIPERHGGVGLGKTAMCVASEELSRAYLGAGSLGTRSEIAAELILDGGTEAQKAAWLPRIASGAVLPTAVFTEPGSGSDLGALATRAERTGGAWAITGAKTWITHAARADLMTVLARTVPGSSDHTGLSVFLAPKQRGQPEEPFPDPGLSGEEIGVLGYRGMKEYALSFHRFRVPAEGLLGAEEGQGFRQLMRTFESARIQTAARAIGVAQAALDTSLTYAEERRAFGRPLVAFPRVASKLALMAVETMIVRQLTYEAARQKDAGARADVAAGMAKLLGARVAWAAADSAVQIHGGTGFALESPASRLLCDARILSIFEGTAEIQAEVVARRLLERD